MEEKIPTKLSSTTPSISDSDLYIIENGEWNVELDRLLRKWKKQIVQRQILHRKATIRDAKKYYYFSVPSALCQALVTTGIFSTIECMESYFSWIRILVGILSTATTFISAYMLIMKFESSSDDNKSASDQYESLYRDIDVIMQLSPHSRGPPNTTMQFIKNRYDDIVRKSPVIIIKEESYIKTVINKFLHIKSESTENMSLDIEEKIDGLP